MKNDLATILAHAQEVGECLEWPCGPNVRPQARVEYALPRAPGTKTPSPFCVRRGVWEETMGSAVPPKYVVWSTCFNLRCVSPGHLRCTTKKVQIRAAIKAGRHEMTTAKRIRIAEARRRRPNIKLSVEAAAEIRVSEEDAQALADKWGVNKSHIHRIRSGKAWAMQTAGYSVFTALGA